jgi:diguanylate cyclase (GGDEF)-like protein
MPQAIPIKTRSVLAITFAVLALAAIIGGMGAHVVSTMRRSADEMDDARALRAAQAAISSMHNRMSSIIRDNAVWDEAYDAITNGRAEDWVYSNWGGTSEDYQLYDAVALTTADGTNTSSYWKGKAFDPRDSFGALFLEQVAKASAENADPIVSFFRRGDQLVEVASQAVQPFAQPSDDRSYSVLSFFKIITADIAAAMATEYQLDDLVLGEMATPSLLSVPLTDLREKPVAYLSWPAKAPGTRVFEAVRPYVIACIALLAVFISAVLAAATAEVRRLKRLAQEARLQATHDSLSGLLNRLGLIESLKHLLGQREHRPPLVLHLLDLDGFKPVNDAWGHAVGDMLLVLVANALRGCHPEVTAVARIGGDEFALVQVGPADPIDIARSVLAVLRRPFQIDGRTIEVDATIGFADEDSIQDPHELLRRADMALYQGKEDGRGRHVAYSRGLDLERERIAELEGDLRRAIERNEIRPLFQPLACAITGQVKGVEALARWHSDGDNVGPDVFIPLAEKSGLIDMLGLQMLRLSVQSAKAWPDLSLSVNVSPIQLCNPCFAGDVLELLAAEQFDPQRLTLEITENVLISNPEQAKRAIDALKLKGIRFSLDDFGCGYASIGALRQFGFDRMKIDRSLVLAADSESSGIDVLKATISLAAALGIPVTAEGIETGRQADVLRDAGCDQLQGYLVGRPMAPEDISNVIALGDRAA